MMRFVLFLAAVAYVGADSDYCSKDIVAVKREIWLDEAKPFIKKDAGCQDGLKELLDGTACGYLVKSSICYGVHVEKKYKELTYDKVNFSHISGGVDKAIELGKTMCNHGGACYAAIVDFVSIKMCVDWKKVHTEGKALLKEYATAGDRSSSFAQALLDMLGDRDISDITDEYNERKKEIDELFEDYKDSVMKLGSGFCADDEACLAETGEYVKKFVIHLGHSKCEFVADICKDKCKNPAASFFKAKKGKNKKKANNPVPCCLSKLINFGSEAVDDASKNAMLDGLFSAATDFFGKYDIRADCFNKIYGQAQNKCKKDNEKN